MTNYEFSKLVTEMIRSEKEEFQKFIENEDWEGLEDEVFEYASQGE